MTTGVNKDNLECFSTTQLESKRTLINSVSKHNKPSYAEYLACSDGTQYSFIEVGSKKPPHVSVISNTVLVIISM